MMLKITSIILLFFMVGCTDSSNIYLTGNLKNDIDSFFPKGRVEVKVLKAGVPPEKRKRYDDILNRIITQYENHKEEFDNSFTLSYLKDNLNNLKQGDINYFVSWDTRLGVSVSEINELSSLKDIYQTSSGVIDIEQSSDNILTIKGVKNINNLQEIKIDISNNIVTTDYGSYKYSAYREPPKKPEDIMADRWRFYSWERDSQNSNTEAHGYNSFYIGQLTATNEIIIFIRNYSQDHSKYDNIIFSFRPSGSIRASRGKVEIKR